MFSFEQRGYTCCLFFLYKRDKILISNATKESITKKKCENNFLQNLYMHILRVSFSFFLYIAERNLSRQSLEVFKIMNLICWNRLFYCSIIVLKWRTNNLVLHQWDIIICSFSSSYCYWLNFYNVCPNIFNLTLLTLFIF